MKVINIWNSYISIRSQATKAWLNYHWHNGSYEEAVDLSAQAGKLHDQLHEILQGRAYIYNKNELIVCIDGQYQTMEVYHDSQ